MTGVWSGDSRAWWDRWWPLLVGTGLAALTVAVSELLTSARAHDMHAMILVFIAAPYAGFGSLDGTPKALATEFIGITVFCGSAVIGLWVWPPMWVLGYAGHALWDVVHHPEAGFGAEIVGWYVPFCASYDLLVAGYLAVVLMG